jgi:hypothetical protein
MLDPLRFNVDALNEADLSGWQPIDIGWSDGGGVHLHCQARTVVQSQETCCFSFCQLVDPSCRWQNARVSLLSHSYPSQLVVHCEGQDVDGSWRLMGEWYLNKVSWIRRLSLSNTLGMSMPGVELGIGSLHPGLQIVAGAAPVVGKSRIGSVLPTVESELIAANRLRLLHTYLSASIEDYLHDLASQPSGDTFTTGWHGIPLEWPLQEGRRASLMHLALALRDVAVIKAPEVFERACFAGPGCPICLEPWNEISTERPVIALKCGHAFCEECLGDAVSHRHAKCPTCRACLGPQ